jgi:hypothetical protein
MARRKPVIDLTECVRFIGERQYHKALYAFEEIMDKLVEAKKSPRGSHVAAELKKLVAALEDSLSFKPPSKSETDRAEAAALVCSFCGKNQDEVRKLIAGPAVYICDECIDLCNDIIAEECNDQQAGTEQATASEESTREPICAFCNEPRNPEKLVPIAAGMRFCTTCIQAIHTVIEEREKK